jgi:hypothetical protein
VKRVAAFLALGLAFILMAYAVHGISHTYGVYKSNSPDITLKELLVDNCEPLLVGWGPEKERVCDTIMGGDIENLHRYEVAGIFGAFSLIGFLLLFPRRSA